MRPNRHLCFPALPKCTRSNDLTKQNPNKKRATTRPYGKTKNKTKTKNENRSLRQRLEPTPIYGERSADPYHKFAKKEKSENEKENINEKKGSRKP